MATEKSDSPVKKSNPTSTDEQVVENLIQMRKYQLGALHKIMSSISKQGNPSSLDNLENTSNGKQKLNGKNKA